MSYHADRIRDDIERVASGDFASILDELGKLADSLNRHSETQDRAITALFDASADHGDAILALSNRIEGVVQLVVGEREIREGEFARRADLDDLRLEVLEATATPFNPPEAA